MENIESKIKNLMFSGGTEFLEKAVENENWEDFIKVVNFMNSIIGNESDPELQEEIKEVFFSNGKDFLERAIENEDWNYFVKITNFLKSITRLYDDEFDDEPEYVEEFEEKPKFERELECRRESIFENDPNFEKELEFRRESRFEDEFDDEFEYEDFSSGLDPHDWTDDPLEIESFWEDLACRD